jgi:hypothetical protein
MTTNLHNPKLQTFRSGAICHQQKQLTNKHGSMTWKCRHKEPVIYFTHHWHCKDMWHSKSWQQYLRRSLKNSGWSRKTSGGIPLYFSPSCATKWSGCTSVAFKNICSLCYKFQIPMEYCSWGILSTSSWNSPVFLRCNSPPDVLRHEPLNHTNFHTNSRILCTAVCNIPDIMEVLSNIIDEVAEKSPQQQLKVTRQW